MNCTKRITLTGYLVKYVVLREPKPRIIHEEIYTMDKDSAEALGLLELNAVDYIAARYQRGGCRVTGIERIEAKRTASMDLRKLWEDAGMGLQENHTTTSDTEVRSE